MSVQLKRYQKDIRIEVPCMGRFQQEAHMSNYQDQRKAYRAIFVHEGLAIGVITIKCRGDIFAQN